MAQYASGSTNTEQPADLSSPELLTRAASTGSRLSAAQQHTLRRAREYGQVEDISDNSLHDYPQLSLLRGLCNYMYPHWLVDHLDYESFKIGFRSWIQYWCTCLLTIIDKPGNWMGATGYVVNMGSAIETAGNISIATSVLIGICNLSYCSYAVACVAVANAITWHLRGYPTKEGTYADLIARGLCPVGDYRCCDEVVLRGEYLATRYTVIHIFALIFCLSTAGYLSVRSQLFRSPWVLLGVTLALDSVGTVVLPYFDPWAAGRTVVLPIGINASARVFFAATVFPSTSNTKYIKGVLNMLKTLTSCSHDLLARSTEVLPSDPDFTGFYVGTIRRLHKVYKGKPAMETDKLMSRFEISYSRLNPDNLVQIHKKVLQIANSLNDFQFFYTEIENGKEIYQEYSRGNQEPVEKTLQRYTSDVEAQLTRSDKYEKYAYSSVGNFERTAKAQQYGIPGLQSSPMTPALLDELYTILTDSHAGVINVAHKLLADITSWLEEANGFKFQYVFYWKDRHIRQKKQADQAKKLECTLNELLNLLALYKHTDISHVSSLFPADVINDHGIFISELMAYHGFSTVTYARRVLELAQYLREIDTNQPAPRFYGPWSGKVWSLKRIGPLFRALSSVEEHHAEVEVQETYQTFNPLSSVQARNPDCTPPKNALHMLGRYFSKCWNLMYDPDILFAVKRALFVIAGLMPAYFRTTAGLFFENRLGWVSVMIALTVGKQAVDGLYGLSMRVFFTILGCFLGCVGWYISRGNPYGYAAVMAVLFAYLSWHRHFSRHLNLTSPVILALTVVIVPGTSWAIEHRNPIGLKLHAGLEVAVVRLVCVLIGLAISFIGTIFPKPYTGKEALRNLEGILCSQIADLQANSLNFAMHRYDHPNMLMSNRNSSYLENKISRLFMVSQSADTLRYFLRYEPPLGGKWPRNRYKVLVNIQQELGQLLWMTCLMFDGVKDTEHIPNLLWRLGWTSPDLTHSTFALLYMSGRAIVSSQPLPSVSPGYLSEMQKRRFENSAELLSPDSLHEDSELGHVALFLARLLYERYDGLLLLIKGLVGETFDVDTRVYNLDLGLDNEKPSQYHSRLHR